MTLSKKVYNKTFNYTSDVMNITPDIFTVSFEERCFDLKETKKILVSLSKVACPLTTTPLKTKLDGLSLYFAGCLNPKDYTDEFLKDSYNEAVSIMKKKSLTFSDPAFYFDERPYTTRFFFGFNHFVLKAHRKFIEAKSSDLRSSDMKAVRYYYNTALLFLSLGSKNLSNSIFQNKEIPSDVVHLKSMLGIEYCEQWEKIYHYNLIKSFDESHRSLYELFPEHAYDLIKLIDDFNIRLPCDYDEMYHHLNLFLWENHSKDDLKYCLDNNFVKISQDATISQENCDKFYEEALKMFKDIKKKKPDIYYPTETDMSQWFTDSSCFLPNEIGKEFKDKRGNYRPSRITKKLRNCTKDYNKETLMNCPRFIAMRCKIFGATTNVRDAWIMEPPMYFYYKRMNIILQQIAGAEEHSALSENATHVFRKLRRKNKLWAMVDCRKFGLTLQHILDEIILKALKEVYNIDFPEYLKLKKETLVYDKIEGKWYRPVRGRGLGLSVQLDHLIHTVILRMLGLDFAVFNDDCVIDVTEYKSKDPRGILEFIFRNYMSFGLTPNREKSYISKMNQFLENYNHTRLYNPEWKYHKTVNITVGIIFSIARYGLGGTKDVIAAYAADNGPIGLMPLVKALTKLIMGWIGCEFDPHEIELPHLYGGWYNETVTNFSGVLLMLERLVSYEAKAIASCLTRQDLQNLNTPQIMTSKQNKNPFSRDLEWDIKIKPEFQELFDTINKLENFPTMKNVDNLINKAVNVKGLRNEKALIRIGKQKKREKIRISLAEKLQKREVKIKEASDLCLDCYNYLKDINIITFISIPECFISNPDYYDSFYSKKNRKNVFRPGLARLYNEVFLSGSIRKHMRRWIPYSSSYKANFPINLESKESISDWFNQIFELRTKTPIPRKLNLKEFEWRNLLNFCLDPSLAAQDFIINHRKIPRKFVTILPNNTTLERVVNNIFQEIKPPWDIIGNYTKVRIGNYQIYMKNQWFSYITNDKLNDDQKVIIFDKILASYKDPRLYEDVEKTYKLLVAPPDARATMSLKELLGTINPITRNELKVSSDASTISSFFIKMEKLRQQARLINLRNLKLEQIKDLPDIKWEIVDDYLDEIVEVLDIDEDIEDTFDTIDEQDDELSHQAFTSDHEIEDDVSEHNDLYENEEEDEDEIGVRQHGPDVGK